MLEIGQFSSVNLRQPKRETAEYVRQHGFPVPVIYASLDEARASGSPFVIRSEHPQDFGSKDPQSFEGASGIGFTLFVSEKPIEYYSAIQRGDPADLNHFLSRPYRPLSDILKMQLFANLSTLSQDEAEKALTTLSARNIGKYCHFANLSAEGFAAQMSYSYWGMLEGVNRVVMADTAIEGRYHIFSEQHSTSYGYPLALKSNYLVVENGKVVQGTPADSYYDSDKNIRRLIETYDGIRALPRFPKGCPIMELQSVGDMHFYLQSQVGADFNGAQFELTRPPKRGEITAIMVRGATPSEGSTIAVTLDFPALVPDARPDINCEAVMDIVPYAMYLEAALRKRVLQLVRTDSESRFFVDNKRHMNRSRILKPAVTIVLKKDDIDPLFTIERTSPRRHLPQINVSYVSDGRKAYLSRI